MSPKFSIIVPLYNKAKYVRKALESIISQTCKDWELIIVDDGSTDNSLEIVHERLKELESERINVISQVNAGVATARNNGVAASNGEYVCFLDADDWLDCDFLKTMNDAIMQCPDAGIYGVNYFSVRNGVAKQVINGLSSGNIDYFKSYYRPPYVMPVCVGSVAIPRKVFDELGGFNTQLTMAEDFDLWTRIALRYPVYYTDKPLAYYNQDVQVRWRAIGKLVDPIHHFVFNADYLLPIMAEREDVRHTVDMVKIVCLKQYYLSRRYHQLALQEFQKIPLEEYQDKPFAAYLWQPVWKERLKQQIYAFIKFLRNR